METFVAVQHCILIRRGLPDSGTPRHNLFGVGYAHEVPPDTEFPKFAAPPWAVYLRLTGWNAGPTRVLFRIHYRNNRREWEEVLRREMDRAIPFPEADEETNDVVLNLPYLRLGGVGLHALSVHFWYDGVKLGEDDPGWAESLDESFRTLDWAFGGIDYFWIERPS